MLVDGFRAPASVHAKIAVMAFVMFTQSCIAAAKTVSESPVRIKNLSVQACMDIARAQGCGFKDSDTLMALKLTCAQTKQDLRCPQLFESATPVERERFLDCEKPEDLCGIVGSPTQVCADGSRTAVLEFGSALVALPRLLADGVGNLPARFSSCQHDEALKKELMGPFRPRDMSDETFRRMSCADIRDFVRTKFEVIFARLDQKVQDAATKSGKQEINYAGIELTDQEAEVLSWDLKQPAPYRQAACYKRSELLRFVCGELTNLAAQIATGYAAGATLRVAGKLGAMLADSGPPIPIRNSLLEKYPKLKAKDSTGTSNGFLTYFDGSKTVGSIQVDTMQNSLHITYMDVKPEYRHQGFARALLEDTLRIHYYVDVIETGSLAETNLAVVKHGIAKGLSVEEAVKNTPAYRMREKLGFEMVPGSINEDFGFQVRRVRPLPPMQPSTVLVKPDKPSKGPVKPSILVIGPEMEQEINNDLGK